MTQIYSYLTFSGNCLEAMKFYRDCFGAELMLQTIGESPLSEKMPRQMKDCILHSRLTKGEIVIMASDMVGTEGLLKGNSVSLMLNCSSEEELRSYYDKLSEGGEATHPVIETHWGGLFGHLIDKFGNYWMLSYNRESKDN